MADVATNMETEAPKASKLPLIAGLVLALVLGGGGFYAVYSGMLFGAKEPKAEEKAEPVAEALPKMSFVQLDPLIVTLGRSQTGKNLRFEGHLEVAPDYAEEIQSLMPRIMDVLNSYLRAVELNDLHDPAALIRLRAQMLRRVQVVTGEGRVRDLLVSTFLIN